MAELPDDGLADGSTRDAELLLYDYFKHMTTLSLVTLGGVLSIPQATGVALSIRELLPAAGLIALGGAFSLYAMEAIIKARLDGRAVSRGMRWTRLIVSVSFGVGVGAFLGQFTDLI